MIGTKTTKTMMVKIKCPHCKEMITVGTTLGNRKQEPSKVCKYVKGPNQGPLTMKPNLPKDPKIGVPDQIFD